MPTLLSSYPSDATRTRDWLDKDMNDIPYPSVKYCQRCTHTPPSSYPDPVFLVLTNGYSTNRFQLAFDTPNNSSATPRMYRRSFNNGQWTSWTECCPTSTTQVNSDDYVPSAKLVYGMNQTLNSKLDYSKGLPEHIDLNTVRTGLYILNQNYVNGPISHGVSYSPMLVIGYTSTIVQMIFFYENPPEIFIRTGKNLGASSESWSPWYKQTFS